MHFVHTDNANDVEAVQSSQPIEERPNRPSAQSYSVQSNTQPHMATHTTGKKFRCPNCDRGFKFSSGLKFHLGSCNTKSKSVSNSTGTTLAHL